ncbi:MAG: DNA alkylation repair protein [Eubacterium sp.]|nr:DNA alkylation repair protein [Eubacterium sp.]
MNLREELFNNQDLEYKAFHSRLVPTVKPDKIIGVRIPVLRKIAKNLAKEKTEFSSEYYEEIMVKGFLIGYKKYDIDERLKAMADFVPMIDNWAVCDCVCSTLKFTEKNRQAVWDFLMQYIDGTEYEVRFLVVMLMNYYLVDEYIDRVNDVLLSIDREEYYINMALAWALSVEFVKYENTVMEIFEKRTLPVWVHNKAIQKTCESFRVSKETKSYLRTLKIK